MGTRVPEIVDRLLAIAAGAVPSDCTVVDSWTGAADEPKVLTIGVRDEGFREVGALTQPSVTVQRSDPIGSSVAQSEQVQVLCSLDIPADGEATPTMVRAEAGAILNAVIAAVTARGAIPGTEGAFATENAWYQGNLAAGWGVVVLFTIHVDCFG